MLERERTIGKAEGVGLVRIRPGSERDIKDRIIRTSLQERIVRTDQPAHIATSRTHINPKP